MNMKRILIVDDDSSVGTMLKFVIAREQLGEVVATVTDEEQAVDEILFYQPDSVLIDLLFPHTDGIRIMKRAMSRGAYSHFIMISQAHDKNLEEMAYKEGIDFFVHKPINVLEIRKVLQNVIQIMEMERMLSAVRQAVTPAAAGPAADDSEQRLREIFADIGILGMTGSREIAAAVRYLRSRRRHTRQEYTMNYMAANAMPRGRRVLSKRSAALSRKHRATWLRAAARTFMMRYSPSMPRAFSISGRCSRRCECCRERVHSLEKSTPRSFLREFY